MSGVKTWSPFYSDERRLNSVLVIKGSFFLKKKKKVSKKKNKPHKLSTDTHTHTHNTYTQHDLCPLSQNQSQTGFRIRRAWDRVFVVRPAGAQSLLFEGTSCFFGMPTAASNSTAKVREQWWPAWRMDVSGYTYTYKTNFF